jgi:anti-anti-sigma regulatory factor
MAQKEEAELVVVNSSARLDNIFKVTNLTFIMKIFETVDEAIGYLKSIW